MGQLSGKVAVVTGGTRGLGYAIAKRFLEDGASVVLGSRSQSSVDASVKRLSAFGAVAGTACDIAQEADVRALADLAVSRFGRIDIWVNNAGLSAPYGPTLDIGAPFEEVLKTNILGTYHGSRVALEHFLRQGGRAKLINLLGRGDTEPVPFQNAYASSKTWVRAFTKALSEEYRSTEVDIFSFNPGLVLTDMISSVEAVRGFEARMKPFETVTKMWGQPAEIPAARALWLASAQSDGKSGREERVLRFGLILRGAIRYLFARMAGKQGPKGMAGKKGPKGMADYTVTVNSVEPAFSSENQHG